MLHFVKTLRFKLLLSYVLIGILPLLFFGNTVSSVILDYLEVEKSYELKNFALRISKKISTEQHLIDAVQKEMLKSEIKTQADENNSRIVIVDKNGFVIIDSKNVDIGRVWSTPLIMQAFDKNSVAKLSGDLEVMNVAVPIIENSEVIGAVSIIASTVEDIKKTLTEIESELVSLTILLILVIVIFVVFISGLLMDPLRKILGVVKKMTEGELSQRVTVLGKDEFGELGVAFNDLTDQLEKVESTRQEFVSNVSHELKTPLSSIKVLSEALLLEDNVPNEMYREFMLDITSEVDRMAHIIDELLILVKLEQNESELDIEAFALNKTVVDIVKRLNPLAVQKNITITVEDIKQVTVEADEMRISLAISNLMENGIKYTPEGGEVKVIINSDHQNAFIAVIDTGIGIAEEEWGKVFLRFYRVDKTRARHTGGTGLGLAITHKAVLLHKGSIKISSKEGEGSSFHVRLPLHSQN